MSKADWEAELARAVLEPPPPLTSAAPFVFYLANDIIICN